MPSSLPSRRRVAGLGLAILSVAIPCQTFAATSDLSLDHLGPTPFPLLTGHVYTNSLIVINHGPDLASPTLRCELPPSFHVVSMASSRGSASVQSSVLIGTLGVLGVGQTAVVHYVYIPTRSGWFLMAEGVQDPAVSDPNTGNDHWFPSARVDPGLGIVEFANAQGSGREGGEAQVTVVRSENIQGTIGVHYTTGSGSAQTGTHFTPASGVLTFNPGETQKTVRISLATDGMRECNEDFSVSLFDAFGPALAIGQTNSTVMIGDQDWQVSGTVRGVSVLPGHPSRTGSGYSGNPRASADGRHVAFVSDATDLTEADSNAETDVFFRDLGTSVTSLISVNRFGTAAGGDEPVINADGRYVAFKSFARDLTTNLMNGSGNVYVRDRLAGQTRLVSVTPEGRSGNADSYNPLISSNGLVVVFLSTATDLVSGTSSGQQNVFLRDLSNGVTRLVSRRRNTASEGDGPSFDPALSADGRYVAFGSEASNLVNQDNNNDEDVFLYDRETDQLTLISVRASGGGSANAASFRPALNANGRVIAFISRAEDLVLTPPVHSPGAYEMNVYVRDMTTATTRMVSANWAGTGGGSGWSEEPSLSAAGDIVAFRSIATNLVPVAGFPGEFGKSHMFVRKLPQGSNSLVTFNCQGTGPNNGDNVGGLTADGRHVVMSSTATDMTPGSLGVGDPQFPWPTYHAYRHDLETGSTALCDANYTYTGAGNLGAGADVAACSADASVIFMSGYASDLVAEDSNENLDVFVWQSLPPGDNAQLRIAATTGTGRGVVFWKLAITNFGPQTANSVLVTNPLPAGCTLLSVHATDGTCSLAGGVVRCEIASLPVRRSADISVFVLVPAAGGYNATAGVAARENDPLLLDNSVPIRVVASMPVSSNFVYTTRTGSFACFTWMLHPRGALVRSDSPRNGNWIPVAPGFIDNGVVAGWVGDLGAMGAGSFFRVRRP